MGQSMAQSMDQSLPARRRREAWRFARTAIRAYERDQNPSNGRQVELAMRYLRETQAGVTSGLCESTATQQSEKRGAI